MTLKDLAHWNRDSNASQINNASHSDIILLAPRYFRGVSFETKTGLGHAGMTRRNSAVSEKAGGLEGQGPFNGAIQTVSLSAN